MLKLPTENVKNCPLNLHVTGKLFKVRINCKQNNKRYTKVTRKINILNYCIQVVLNESQSHYTDKNNVFGMFLK